VVTTREQGFGLIRVPVEWRNRDLDYCRTRTVDLVPFSTPRERTRPFLAIPPHMDDPRRQCSDIEAPRAARILVGDGASPLVKDRVRGSHFGQHSIVESRLVTFRSQMEGNGFRLRDPPAT